MKRAAAFGDRDLDIMLSTILNSALPQTYESWTKGHASQEDVDTAFQAAIASWEDLSNRAYQDRQRRN